MSNLQADGRLFFKFGREHDADQALTDDWGDEYKNLPDHLRRMVAVDFAYASGRDKSEYIMNIRRGNLEAYALTLAAEATNMLRKDAQERWAAR